MPQRILVGAIFCALLPAAFAQARHTTIRAREDVWRAQREKRIDPVYPQAAVKAGIHGLVELQVRISQTGDVQSVELVSGDPVLAPSAIDAVKHWHYKPYLLNGTPMIVYTKVTLNYTLSSGEGVALDAPVRATPAH